MHRHQKLSLGLALALSLLICSCNGLETDVSKKLDFQFPLNATDAFLASTVRVINIPGHDEIDDYVDYAVFPDAFTTNDVSYQITSVGLANTSQQVDIEAFYRTVSLDTVSLFRVTDVLLVPNERMEVPVNLSDLNTISNLINTQSTFIMIVEATGDTQSIDFTLDIFFDTTISIDYDL